MKFTVENRDISNSFLLLDTKDIFFSIDYHWEI